MKHVLITGTSSGIGLACVKELDKTGMYNVFATVRKELDFKRVNAQTSSNVLPVFLDVTNEDSIKSAYELIEEKVGDNGLFALVNNAAYISGGAFEYYPMDELKRTFDVNFFGPVRMAKTFLPSIRKARGRIINIGSINGIVPVPMLGAYCTSKFALEAFTKILGLELQIWNIPVSIIDPNLIRTPAWQKTIDLTETLFTSATSNIKSLYTTFHTKGIANAKITEKKSKGPKLISKALLKALSSKYPKRRYLPGIDNKLVKIMSAILPPKIFDHMILKEMGFR